MAEQLSLLDDAWIRRDELDLLARIIELAYAKWGHMREPEYDRPTRWPRLVEHCYYGVCAVFVQRRDVFGPLVTGTQFRAVFVDQDGCVVDESAWCSTEGGVRGYINRARASTAIEGQNAEK